MYKEFLVSVVVGFFVYVNAGTTQQKLFFVMRNTFVVCLDILIRNKNQKFVTLKNTISIVPNVW